MHYLEYCDRRIQVWRRSLPRYSRYFRRRCKFPFQTTVDSDAFSYSGEERHVEHRARTDEPKGGRSLQWEVDRAEAGAARRLLGALQLRADEHGGEMLGERDIYHARRLHVPG